MEELGSLGNVPAPLGLKWWRARLLYILIPFDRSIFGQLRDPLFLVLTCISLVPIWGIRVIFFFLVLVCIVAGCPPDEYQLVAYIIGFKGSQFISSGMLQACAAAVRYYLCVHPGGAHTCDVDGPGAQQDLASGLVDFFGSCVLTWAAFFFLPYSDRIAGDRTVTDDEQVGASTKSTTCCGHVYDTSRGGRLRELLGWELISFLLSLLFCAGLCYVDVSHARPGGVPTTNVHLNDVIQDANTWSGHTAIYWARVFYSFLSFPFVFFLIPGLSSILSHTRTTGYNRNGLCVPFLMHPMPEEQEPEVTHAAS